MDGYAVRAGGHRRRPRVAPTVLRLHRPRLHRRAVRWRGRAGRLRRDRDRRARARRRRRGRDGRGHGRPGTPDGRRRRGSIQAAGAGRGRPGSTSSAAAPTCAPATSCCAPVQALKPSRIGALAAIGAGTSRSRQAGRRDLPNRQRGGAPGPAAAAGVGLRRQPLHGRGAGGAARRRPGAHAPRAGHGRRRSARARCGGRTPTIVVLGGGSSVGERDVMSTRSRRAARCFSTASRSSRASRRCSRASASSWCSGCRQPDVVPVERARPADAGPAAPGAACRRSSARGSGVALASAVSSPANRHQFLPVRIEGELAVADVQGIRRDHEPVAGGRLHRDPGRRGPPRRRSK